MRRVTLTLPSRRNLLAGVLVCAAAAGALGVWARRRWRRLPDFPAASRPARTRIAPLP